MNRITTLVLIMAGCAAARASDIPPPRPVDVAALVRQLGSKDLAEREAATNRLASLPLDEPPAELLAALKSPNPDVRDRAAKVVEAIRTRGVVKRMARGEGFARRGEIDLFVAATITWDLKAEDQRLWIPPFEVGTKAVTRAVLTGDRKPQGGPTWFSDFRKYRVYRLPRFIRTDGVYSRPEKDADGKPLGSGTEAILAAGVANPKSLRGLVVSRGSVSAKTVINSSLILATGDVTAGDEMNDSVVLCDGNVFIAKHTRICLIIARGKITVGASATTCTLIAGGTIKITDPESQVEGLENVLMEKEPKPLGYITFFELSRVGLEVKVVDKSVQVAKVTAGKPCEKAGLKVGDVIHEVNGRIPTDAESLRRILRDNLAIGDATVKVQRGEKTETLKVALPE